MATRAALAQMDAEARGRLDRALERIAARLGVEIPAPPRYDRNPNNRAMQQITWHADVVECIDGALAGRDEPPDPLELRGLTRTQLEAHAADLGIANPADYPNKPALIAAIERWAAGEETDEMGEQDPKYPMPEETPAPPTPPYEAPVEPEVPAEPMPEAPAEGDDDTDEGE